MRMLILGIVGLSGLGWAVQSVGVHGSTNERAAIRRALRAPFVDLKRRDARALCGDFTPSVAAHLASGASGDCEQRVSTVFMRAHDVGEYISARDGSTSGRLTPSVIRWHGGRATTTLSDQIGGVGRESLQLEMHAQRWRIATTARLELHADCGGHPFGGAGCVDAISLRFPGV
jgi:hypothetical protein